MSLRRVREDGEIGDIIGFVRDATADGLTITDRHGQRHALAWDQVLAWRQVGVARGRDPLRTPLEELDALAAAAGVQGRVFVARLGDLLDGAEAPRVAELGTPPPQPAVVAGEWVTAGTTKDLLALAWWATHHDARSMQVRTDEPAAVGQLLAAGFTERLT
ncbi:MAG TPA: hypothetical protein VFW55_12250 [Propionicimonas sp.]|nr:hypothetical protein [Propionicimonas sp.]